MALIKNPDIVATIAQLEDKPFVIGFAAETQDVATYARGKLTKKNLDMIILIGKCRILCRTSVSSGKSAETTAQMKSSN